MSHESTASTIGFINLDKKTTRKRSAGKPHAAFDEAGAGNGRYNEPRQFSTLPVRGIEVLHKEFNYMINRKIKQIKENHIMPTRRKILLLILLTTLACFPSLAGEQKNLVISKRANNGYGMLCKFKNGKDILFIEGTPKQMGQAHGQLLTSGIKGMEESLLVGATAYMYIKDDWFFTRIQEVIRRTNPFVPKRFLVECDAMSKAAGITTEAGRHMNYFPEMFHCSGVAVRGSATTNGQVVHARVLDYMSKMNFQNYATLMVFMPKIQ